MSYFDVEGGEVVQIRLNDVNGGQGAEISIPTTHAEGETKPTVATSESVVEKYRALDHSVRAESSNPLLYKPGDLLRFRRGLYSHWAVYLGKHQLTGGNHKDCSCADVPENEAGMIHFSGLTSDADQSAQVCYLPLTKVKDHWVGEIANDWDKQYPPSQPHVILARAYTVVGTDFGGYSLITNNCEHFATWLRYGLKLRKQVENTMINGGTAGAGLPVAGPVGAVLAAGFFGNIFDDGDEKENAGTTHEADVSMPNRALSGSQTNLLAVSTHSGIRDSSLQRLRSRTGTLIIPPDQHVEFLLASARSDLILPMNDNLPTFREGPNCATDCVDLEKTVMAVAELATLSFGLVGLGIEGLIELSARASTKIPDPDGHPPWTDAIEGYETASCSSEETPLDYL